MYYHHIDYCLRNSSPIPSAPNPTKSAIFQPETDTNYKLSVIIGLKDKSAADNHAHKNEYQLREAQCSKDQ